MYPHPQGAATNNASWTVEAFRAGDPLAKWLIDNVGGSAEEFFYSHHTFSHQNLDNATTYDTDIQIGLNIQMAVGSRSSARKSTCVYVLMCGVAL